MVCLILVFDLHILPSCPRVQQQPFDISSTMCTNTFPKNNSHLAFRTTSAKVHNTIPNKWEKLAKCNSQATWTYFSKSENVMESESQKQIWRSYGDIMANQSLYRTWKLETSPAKRKTMPLQFSRCSNKSSVFYRASLWQKRPVLHKGSLRIFRINILGGGRNWRHVAFLAHLQILGFL